MIPVSTGGHGTRRTSPIARCLSWRRSRFLPESVHGFPACGSAASNTNSPHPSALLVIDRSVSIAVQDQVRRRVGVDTVTWAGRTRELRVVIHPVESKQRRSPRWREDLGFERVAPAGQEQVGARKVGDDRTHRAGDTDDLVKVDRSTAVEVDQEGAADDRFCSRAGPH
jgi:hypothetical protein